MIYKDRCGTVVTGKPEAVKLFKSISEQYDKNKREWIDLLKHQGVMGAHPDDGWVDREKNCVVFRYPHYNLYPKEGDKIALGWHTKHRVVEVVKAEVRENLCGESIKYFFK